MIMLMPLRFHYDILFRLVSQRGMRKRREEGERGKRGGERERGGWRERARARETKREKIERERKREVCGDLDYSFFW